MPLSQRMLSFLLISSEMQYTILRIIIYVALLLNRPTVYYNTCILIPFFWRVLCSTRKFELNNWIKPKRSSHKQTSAFPSFFSFVILRALFDSTVQAYYCLLYFSKKISLFLSSYGCLFFLFHFLAELFLCRALHAFDYSQGVNCAPTPFALDKNFVIK